MARQAAGMQLGGGEGAQGVQQGRVVEAEEELNVQGCSGGMFLYGGTGGHGSQLEKG